MVQSQLENLGSALTDGFKSSDQQLITGVTSFGLSSIVCAGVDFAYRTDQADVIAWILATVPKREAALIQIVQF
jgi:hypothetical protein